MPGSGGSRASAVPGSPGTESGSCTGASNLLHSLQNEEPRPRYPPQEHGEPGPPGPTEDLNQNDTGQLSTNTRA